MIDFGAALKELPIAPEVIDALVPAVSDPFDPAPVRELFARFQGEIDGMQGEALAITVTDDKTYVDAQEMMGRARKLRSRIEAKRKELKQPFLAHIKFLDGEAGAITQRLDDIAGGIENLKMLPYAMKKEAERREAERKAQEEARIRQAELDRQAREAAEKAAAEAREKAASEGKDAAGANLAARQAAAQVEPAPVVVPDIPRETKVTTDSATSKIEYDWDWELVDLRQLPDDILSERREQIVAALKPAINNRIKAGIRSIAGLKIYRVEKLKTRTRG